MAATFVGSSIAADTDGDNSVVVTVPAGTQDGDLMIMARGSVNLAALATHASFTAWPTVNSVNPAGFNATMDIDYRVASSEPASYTVACGARHAVLLFVIRGLDAPVDPVTDYSTTDWALASGSAIPANVAITNKSDLTVPQPIIYVGYAQTTTTSGGADRFSGSGTGAFDEGVELCEHRIIVNTVAPLTALYVVAFKATNTVDRNGDVFRISNGGLGNWFGNGVWGACRIFGASLLPDSGGPGWGWHGAQPYWQEVRGF
jgi:hypothetical protein